MVNAPFYFDLNGTTQSTYQGHKPAIFAAIWHCKKIKALFCLIFEKINVIMADFYPTNTD
ncbi:MAG: hypothetical protein C0424_03605 [Sphingobacteriaceae bacterium]|nr:hypothetical protein [Sphingobacteriaceae bacterium]